MTDEGTPIGGYEDWPAHARAAARWRPPAGPDERGSDEKGRAAFADVLGLPALVPEQLTVGDPRTVDDVEIREVGWSVGFGPRTRAWLLRPAGVDGRLPGVLGLHCHGGVRSVGAEQLIDLGPDDRPRARWLRDGLYEGGAPANDLARQGVAVLAHDTFSWGSRRFDLSRPTAKLAGLIAALEARWRAEGVVPTDDERFDAVSSWHEETLAKTAGILGQSFAGLVLADDLAALAVLAADPGVDPDRLGCFGFSGGGGRSVLLAALDHRIRAAVVTCMMATFASVVPGRIDDHSWLWHSPGLAALREWPDVTGLARARFLVQYREDDALFTPEGMRAADRRLRELHTGSDRYRGRFRPGPHGFGAAEQAEAVQFLAEAL